MSIFHLQSVMVLYVIGQLEELVKVRSQIKEAAATGDACCPRDCMEIPEW